MSLRSVLHCESDSRTVSLELKMVRDARGSDSEKARGLGFEVASPSFKIDRVARSLVLVERCDEGEAFPLDDAAPVRTHSSPCLTHAAHGRFSSHLLMDLSHLLEAQWRHNWRKGSLRTHLDTPLLASMAALTGLGEPKPRGHGAVLRWRGGRIPPCLGGGCWR